MGNHNVIVVENRGSNSQYYTVECDQRSLTFKVALPLAPKARVMSEVATILLVQERASISAPKVIAYDAKL